MPLCIILRGLYQHEKAGDKTFAEVLHRLVKLFLARRSIHSVLLATNTDHGFGKTAKWMAFFMMELNSRLFDRSASSRILSVSSPGTFCRPATAQMTASFSLALLKRYLFVSML